MRRRWVDGVAVGLVKGRDGGGGGIGWMANVAEGAIEGGVIGGCVDGGNDGAPAVDADVMMARKDGDLREAAGERGEAVAIDAIWRGVGGAGGGGNGGERTRGTIRLIIRCILIAKTLIVHY